MTSVVVSQVKLGKCELTVFPFAPHTCLLRHHHANKKKKKYITIIISRDDSVKVALSHLPAENISKFGPAFGLIFVICETDEL